jgi:hypothetical protein
LQVAFLLTTCTRTALLLAFKMAPKTTAGNIEQFVHSPNKFRERSFDFRARMAKMKTVAGRQQ